MRLVWALLVCILCLPLAFVLYLVAAARYPSMDGFTARLPPVVGSAVSQIALRRAGYGKDDGNAIHRALQLDPESADAWTRLCHLNDDAGGHEATCRKAVSLSPTAWNFNSLGAAQERSGDFCTAEDSYTMSVQKTSNNAFFFYEIWHVRLSVAAIPARASRDSRWQKVLMQRLRPILMMTRQSPTLSPTANAFRPHTTARSSLRKPLQYASRHILTGKAVIVS